MPGFDPVVDGFLGNRLTAGMGRGLAHGLEKIAKGSFTRSTRNKFYDQLRVYLNNGIPILDAIRALQQRAVKRRGRFDTMAVVLDDIHNRQRGGLSFAEAVKPYVSQFEAMIMVAGEKSGDLGKALTLIIETSKSASEIRGSLMQECSEPVIYILSLYVFLYIIGRQAVPQLEKFLPPEKWKGAARGLLYCTYFAQGYSAVLAPVGILVFMVALFMSFPRMTGSLRRRLDNFFPWSFYRLFQGVIWLQSFCSLTGAGVTHIQALESMSVFASPWLAERMRTVARMMRGLGLNLGQAMERSGYGFPSPDIVDDILVYSSFGDFDVKMGQMAAAWRAQANEKIVAAIKIVTRVSFFAILIFMGYVIVGVDAVNDMIASSVSGGGGVSGVH